MNKPYNDACMPCMQDVHVLFPLEQLMHRVADCEHQFANQETVTLIDWGCSYKEERGYIVLEWDSEIDAAFLHHLEVDPDVFDYCVYSVPCSAFEGQDALNIA